MVEGWHAMCVKWDRIGANEQSGGGYRLNRGPRHPSAYPQLTLQLEAIQKRSQTEVQRAIEHDDEIAKY